MHRKKRGCFSRFLYLCLLVAILGACWLYGNYTIDVDEITVSSASLPESFKSFRVAVVSDLHGRDWGDALLEALEKAQPDIIALCGDIIDENTDLSVVRPFLQGVKDIAPCFYVTGNHEWVSDKLNEFSDMLEDYGITRLKNDYRVLTLEGQSIVLAGVEDPNGPYDMKTPGQLVEEIRSEQGDDLYILMLAHRNDQMDQWDALGVDTVVCGHGHGGIVRIPFVGGLFGVDRSLLPKYTSGLYRQGSTNMVVSRGLSATKYDIRIFNRPHVPVLVLE